MVPDNQPSTTLRDAPRLPCGPSVWCVPLMSQKCVVHVYPRSDLPRAHGAPHLAAWSGVLAMTERFKGGGDQH